MHAGMTPQRAELLRRAEARRELERRRRDGGVRYFAAQEQQASALASDPKGLLILGGNRSGKTVLGAAETVYRHLGRHPYKTLRHRPPLHSWCLSQLLPGSTDKPHVQLEEIRRWAPTDALRGGSWSTAYSPGARTLTWADGGVTEFKSYDQDLLQFEAAKIHWCWFDEEPARREIFTSILLRLVDYRGQWMMTLTPVLSLQGQGWVEELWDARNEAERTGDYLTFQLLTSSNPHLPSEEVDRLQRLPDEEKAVRLYGAFARLGGRVLSEYDPGRHLTADFLPPREWRHYLLIDPGWHRAAHLFAAVDSEGRCWLYAEHYQGERRPEEHMAVLHALWQAFDEPEYDTLMDPAGFAIKRTTTGRESPSDADEYRAAAEKLGADWFGPRPANNGDAYAWRVKRYLQADMLKICRSLRWWQWEQERWTRQKERGGVLAGEKPVPDAPIDRNNHLMDLSRYLCNELPDPLPLPESTHYNAYEEHWRRERERLDREQRGEGAVV